MKTIAKGLVNTSNFSLIIKKISIKKKNDIVKRTANQGVTLVTKVLTEVNDMKITERIKEVMTLIVLLSPRIFVLISVA